MLDIPQKVNGNTVNADEFNSMVNALENAIRAAGITLSIADTFQLARSLANHVAFGNIYSVSSSANQYTFTPIGSFNHPTAYTNGMVVRGFIDADNTGASTIIVGALAEVPIRSNNATTELASWQMRAGYHEFVYISSQNAFNLIEKGQSRISSNDTTLGYLFDKLNVGSGLSLQVNNDGGNENITLSANFASDYRTHYIERLSQGQTVITMGFAIINDQGGGLQENVKRHLITLNGQQLINSQFNTLISPDVGDYTVTNASIGEITLATPVDAGEIFVYLDVTQQQPVGVL